MCLPPEEVGTAVGGRGKREALLDYLQFLSLLITNGKAILFLERDVIPWDQRFPLLSADPRETGIQGRLYKDVLCERKNWR